MASRRTGTVALIAAAAVVVAAVIAALVLGRGDGGPSGEPTSKAPSHKGASPFTGLPGTVGPVLAVKIDNARAARPQTGLGAADIVYVEQVEGGQTRFLAVYSSRMPPSAGPVRSARESDLELLRQFGSPAFAYSGAQSRLYPLIAAAPVHDLRQGRAPSAYHRSDERPAPHNLYLRPQRALDAAPGADRARDIGFRFGDAPEGGRAADEHTVRFPTTTCTFTWSAEKRRWLVAVDREPLRTTDAGPLTPATVVVQDVKVRPSRFRDRWGSVSPYTETVGSGAALVLRDGKAYRAHWSRPDPDGGTSFTTPSGKPMTFAPGQVWVVYRSR